MITTSERDEFVRKIGAWRFLGVEEQENVVSMALERYDQKSRTESIPNRVGWLLSAASLIKHEVGRERKKWEETISAIIEARSVDRRKNGVPIGCERAVSEEASQLDGPSERELACQRVLDSLSPIDRQIAELCGIQGLQPAEAGRFLSLSRSTAKSRWERLRAKLRLDPTLQHVVSFGRRVAR
jgi:DNA-binding CsgD family transcriptional regulator